MQPLTCPRCGANLAPTPQSALLQCAYCGVQVNAAAPAPRVPPLDWKIRAAHPDGRLFVSDGSLLIDARWVPCPAVPQRTIPVETLLNILQKPTTQAFHFADLRLNGATGHYVGPGEIVLGRSYIDYLTQAIPAHAQLVLRTSGRLEPMLLESSGWIIGALMPRSG